MSEPSEDEGSLFVSYQAFVFVQLERENIGEVSTQNNNKVSKHVHFIYGWVRKQLLILTDALYKLQILTFFLAPTIYLLFPEMLPTADIVSWQMYIS